MKKVIFILFLFFSVFVTAKAQTADVYFYRVKEVNGLDNRHIQIFLDDKEIFETKQTYWVGFKIKAGNYALRAKQKRSETLLKLEAGKSYFIRLSKTPEGFFLAERIEIIPDSEQAIFQMRDLKPLETKKIKTKELVQITDKPK